MFFRVSRTLWTATSLVVSLLAGVGCRGPADSGGTSGATPTVTSNLELVGVDTTSLTPRERRDWSSYVSEMLAPCKDTPVPLAQCVQEKRSCTRCLPAARFLVKQVREGGARDQVTEAYRARFDSDRVKSIDVTETPLKGPPTAPITIVEWADFQCPFCKRATSLLEEVMAKFPDKVRFFFKNYPLPIHPLAETAARAAVAAGAQNKFWEMHHKLFEGSPASLEPPAIDALAKDIGLNLERFKADMASEATNGRLNREKKQAEALNFAGTPLIYINGRLFSLKGDFAAELEEWIRTDLDLLGPSNSPPAPPPLKPLTTTAGSPSSPSGGK